MIDFSNSARLLNFRLLHFTLLLGLILPTLALGGWDWSTLDRYQETRSREYVIEAQKLLIKNDPSVREYADRFLKIDGASFRVYDPFGKLEYTYRFGNKAAPTTYDSSQGELGGLKVALDANDTNYRTDAQQIARDLKEILDSSGARTSIIRSVPLAEALNEANGFAPDLAVAIRLDPTYQKSVLSFCPGCFLKGEMDGKNPSDEYAVRFRFRLVHALVSGKLYESAKLAAHISSQFRHFTDARLLTVRESDFGGSVCPVPASPELKETCRKLSLDEDTSGIPGIAGRNLFFNGVYSPAVVFTFVPFQSSASAEGRLIASRAFFEGIRFYILSSLQHS